MLNLKFILIILLSLLFTANLAQAKTNFMEIRLEDNLIDICEALKSDSKLKLRRAIKKSGFKEHAVMQGLVCNGMDPITFALSENANVTAHYAAVKSGVKYITVAQKQLLTQSEQTLTQE